MGFGRLRRRAPDGDTTADALARRVVLIRPETGGVAYGARACARELRSRGCVVTELAGDDRGSPALRGLREVWAHRSCVRRADVVHAELGVTALAAFWLALWVSVLRRDLVTVSHDGPLLVGAPGSGVVARAPGLRDAVAHKVLARLLDRPLRALLRRRTKVWVALSAEAARDMETAGYAPVVRVAYGADPPGDHPPPSRCDSVVYAGYIAPAKGLDRLVAAYEALGSSTGLRLHVVGQPGAGDHDYAADLRRRLERSGAAFTWQERLDDAAFNEVIARAAVVVIPYRRSNPISGIVIRAAVEGRPIVGTPVPAITGPIADGLPCVLLEDGEPDSVAAALTSLAADAGRRDWLGHAAARWGASRCSWSRHVDGLEAAYARAGAAPTG